MMNKTILMGRLTAAPEVRYTTAGNTSAVARFNFAVSRRFKKEGEPDADFFQCVAFGKVAETFEKCAIDKGTKLLLDGEMRNNNYEKDGVKHYGMQVVVNSFEFCESKTSSGSEPAPAQASAEDFTPLPDTDDDLPF